MKRIIIFVLTAAILLSMGGCTKKKADNTVEVFCLNMDVTSSVPESYVLRSKNSDVDKQVDELLGRLQDKPEDSRLRKAIPDEVSVRGHEEKNYNSLSKRISAVHPTHLATGLSLYQQETHDKTDY